VYDDALKPLKVETNKNIIVASSLHIWSRSYFPDEANHQNIGGCWNVTLMFFAVYLPIVYCEMNVTSFSENWAKNNVGKSHINNKLY